MAKSIRTLKADLCDDETLATVSRDARYLFVGLITRADDHGRIRSNPSLIRSRVYPYDDDVTTEMVDVWLNELVQAKRVALYAVEGQHYGVLVNWGKHQRIDNAARSEFPPPPEGFCGPPPQPAANLGEPPLEGMGEEGRGGDGARRCPDPFAVTDEHRAWAVTRAPNVDLDLEAEKMTNWARGKGVRRKSWDATFRNWCLRAQGDKPATEDDWMQANR